ncbi:MAG: hypothetical protein VYC38_06815, partial [Pseudomonadota bacterium]|nr:hypothetical protein [Pseudomonadota bacterium]
KADSKETPMAGMIRAKPFCKAGLVAAMIAATGPGATAESKASPTLVNCTADTLEVNVDAYRQDGRHVKSYGKYVMAPNARQTVHNVRVYMLLETRLNVKIQGSDQPYENILINPSEIMRWCRFPQRRRTRFALA